MEQMGRKDLARDDRGGAGVPVVPGRAADRADPRHRARRSRCWSRPPPAAAARGCGSSATPATSTPRSPRPRSARPPSAFGDDTAPARAVRRARPARRGAGARRPARQRRAPLRARLLGAAPPPEGARGGAGRRRSPTRRGRSCWTPPSRWREQVGYENAGTVEFLVAGEPGRRGGVLPRDEHPAPGRAPRHRAGRLGRRAAARPRRPPAAGRRRRAAAVRPGRRARAPGHAIEARVYAEDPFNGFLPQAGTADAWSAGRRGPGSTPPSSPAPRSARRTTPCSARSSRTGPTREAARRALVAALDDTAILGLTTNLGFLRALADSDEFRDDEVDTAWLDRNPDAIRPPDPDVAALVAAWVAAPRAAARDARRTGGRPGPFAVADGWRLGGPPAPVVVELVVDGETAWS